MAWRVTPPVEVRTGYRRGAPGAPSCRPRAFTLMEAMLAVVIVGTGILASLQLFEVCTGQSRAAQQATTARMLADNIREAMAGLAFNDPSSGSGNWGPEPGEVLATFDDLDDFDGPLDDRDPGTTFNPPIDSTKERVTELARYAQKVTVMPVLPSDPSGNDNEDKPNLPKTGYTGAVRVRVRVKHQRSPTDPWVDVYTTAWVVAHR